MLGGGARVPPPPPAKNRKIYITEAITPSFLAYERLFGEGNISGSEYLGNDKTGGVVYDYKGWQIMHQDCTNLSFRECEFDMVISQHVLEHIFNYQDALKEFHRILKPGGLCVISIPFQIHHEKSKKLAEQDKDGKIKYLCPPEIHGDPVSDGSLCFWHHGWEFVTMMKEAGFSDVNVRFYNNVYKGYWGCQSLITAVKH